jgi:hypothetical protein
MQEFIKKLEKHYGKPISEFDEYDWRSISQCQNLSEDFIREFQHKVNWFKISIHQKLSDDFKKEFQHKIK